MRRFARFALNDRSEGMNHTEGAHRVNEFAFRRVTTNDKPVRCGATDIFTASPKKETASDSINGSLNFFVFLSLRLINKNISRKSDCMFSALFYLETLFFTCRKYWRICAFEVSLFWEAIYHLASSLPKFYDLLVNGASLICDVGVIRIKLM